MKNKFLIGTLAFGLCVSAQATERLFTYTYEPETMPAGAAEFEQWVTLRSQRTSSGPAVTQQNYNRWDLREEFEYGVTDNYTLGLYLNSQSESFSDTSTSPSTSSHDFSFKGISLENRLMLWNPAEHPFGLTLYLEPGFSGDEAEIEQKILIGQRHGSWKWAFNLVHATEWGDNFHETEGELEGDLGVAYVFNPKWSLGFEFRNHNELPEYNEWENTAFFLGPVVSYRNENWWAALSVMPQVYGRNFTSPDPDGESSLELEGHERVNIRLLFGITF